MAIWAGSAISKFSEWVGSAVVNKLVSTGYSYLRERILPYNSEAELKRLKTALPQITAVMGVAEALKVKHPNTSKWVEQFRQAFEASQLVLNELEYKNQDEAGESASSSKKRKRCTINDGTSKRLKDAVTLMDRATTDIDRLLRLATTLGVHGVSESQQDTNKILRREINLCLAERKVFGSTNVFVNVTHLKFSPSPILKLNISLSRTMSSLKNLRSLSIDCASLTRSHILVIERFEWLKNRRQNRTIQIGIGRFRSGSDKADPILDQFTRKASLRGKRFRLILDRFRPNLNRSRSEVASQTAFRSRSESELEPALNQSGLEAFQGLTCSACNVGFLKVTSSDVAELKNRERHDVGESSHWNEFITMDVD